LNDVPQIITQHQLKQQQQQQQQQQVDPLLGLDTTPSEMEEESRGTFNDNDNSNRHSVMMADTISSNRYNATNHTWAMHHHHENHNYLYHDRKRRKIERTTTSSSTTSLWLRLLGTVVNLSSMTVGQDMKQRLEGVVVDVNEDEENQMTDENIIIGSRPPNTTELPPPPPPPPPSHAYHHTMTMDDGTGKTIMIHVTEAMIQKIHLQCGMIVDCIVRVEHTAPPVSQTTIPNQSSSSHHIKPNDISSIYCRTTNIRFMADQIVVQDSNKETLRWLELSYQASLKHRQIASSSTTTTTSSSSSSSSSPGPLDIVNDDDHGMFDYDDSSCNGNNKNNNPMVSSPSLSSPPRTKPSIQYYHTAQSSQWRGYPTRDLSSEDIYRIIASECEYAAMNSNHHHHNNNNCVVPTTTNSNTTTTSTAGVSLQDLADCFNYSTAYIATLVQELQNSGQIYQNENGLYTLL
jgi:hypothetical protein